MSLPRVKAAYPPQGLRGYIEVKETHRFLMTPDKVISHLWKKKEAFVIVVGSLQKGVRRPLDRAELATALKTLHDRWDYRFPRWLARLRSSTSYRIIKYDPFLIPYSHVRALVVASKAEDISTLEIPKSMSSRGLNPAEMIHKSKLPATFRIQLGQRRALKIPVTIKSYEGEEAQ